MHIGVDELDVVGAGRRGVAAGDFEKRLAAVDAEHRTVRPDPLGQLDRGVAEAAADIHRPVTLAHFERRKYFRAVVGQAADQDVAVLG